MSRFISLCLISTLVACSGSRKLVNTDATKPTGETLQRNKIAQAANNLIGVKYRYGGNNQHGLDCSGLVYRVFQDFSIDLPRSSRDQISAGRPVELNRAKPGDLIFFRQNGRINHVAIITGIKQGAVFITHSTTSQGVIRENLFESDYWSSRMVAVKDVMPVGVKR